MKISLLLSDQSRPLRVAARLVLTGVPARPGTGRRLYRQASGVLMAWACLAGPAQADRPLSTKDADVLGKRACEIEIAGTRETESRSRTAQAGCGLGLATQLELEAETTEGQSSTGLSGKTLLWELTEDQGGVALAYAWSTTRNSASARHSAGELKGVVTLPYQGWLLHGNLGWQRAQADGFSRTTWALAAERPGVLGPLDLMAETFGDNRGNCWVQMGARWALVPDRLYVDASWGRHTRDRARQMTLGLTVAID